MDDLESVKLDETFLFSFVCLLVCFIHPDKTVMVDRALKFNYLPVCH